MHTIRKNIRPTKQVTTDEMMKQENNDLSKQYLPQRKVANRE